MPVSVELMMFDFDGTLVTSGEDIANSVNYTLQCLNLPILEKKRILTFIGDGIVKLIERATGEEGRGHREKALEIFSHHYEMHMLDHAALYPGVHDLLEHFRGKRKIILTNKRFLFTEKMVTALGIQDFFEEIVAADSTPFIKPDPMLVEMILERYPVTKEKTVMIGDGVNDVLLARNAGIISCCYLSGLGKRDDLIGLSPDIVFEHFQELKDKFV